MGHFSKTADLNPFSYWYDKIPLLFYDAKKAMFIYIR